MSERLLPRGLPAAFCAVLAVCLLSGCALSGGPRAAGSSLGCMQKVMHEHVPQDLPDKTAHCMAAGLIAWHCSAIEAGLAGTGKEIRDVFGRGNAEWADLQASRRGISCARRATTEADVLACCR